MSSRLCALPAVLAVLSPVVARGRWPGASTNSGEAGHLWWPQPWAAHTGLRRGWFPPPFTALRSCRRGSLGDAGGQAHTQSSPVQRWVLRPSFLGVPGLGMGAQGRAGLSRLELAPSASLSGPGTQVQPTGMVTYSSV